VFRLSRVRGAARKVGQPGSYEIPADTDIKEVARRLAPAPTAERAVLLARRGAAWPLRRSADSIEEDVAGPDRRTGWDRLVLTRGAVGLVEEVLGFGADVYVEEPAGLRDEVVGRLREAVS
jgi:proteasome accessory factor B